MHQKKVDPNQLRQDNHASFYRPLFIHQITAVANLKYVKKRQKNDWNKTAEVSENRARSAFIRRREFEERGVSSVGRASDF